MHGLATGSGAVGLPQPLGPVRKAVTVMAPASVLLWDRQAAQLSLSKKPGDARSDRDLSDESVGQPGRIGLEGQRVGVRDTLDNSPWRTGSRSAVGSTCKCTD